MRARAWWVKTVALSALVGAWLSMGCRGCTDDTIPEQTDPAEECGPDERYNPISGECELTRINQPPPDNNTPDEDMGADPEPSDMPPEAEPDEGRAPPPDMPMVMVDLRDDDDRCAAGIDSDGDGLDNDCECNFMPQPLDPGNSDTDGDGLSDGYEDENKNCMADGTETLPFVADTDSDGIDDGIEANTPGLNPLKLDSDGDGIPDGVEYDSCLDPTSIDTDGDGIEDGIEDANKDGQIGICPDRMYEPGCAQGEYDPCKADTDGDGELDGDEVNFLGCREEFYQQIPAPNLLESGAGDYKLAIAEQAQGAPVSGLNAHAFNHPQQSYAGFIVSLPRPGGSVEDLRGWVLAQIQSEFPGARLASNGRRTVTHDGFDAIVSVKFDMGEAGQADVGRDRALRGLAGVGSVSHGLGGSFNASISNLSMVTGIIDRGGGQFLVTAALASDAVYESRSLETGYLIDDTTSAMSVATMAEELEEACVAYRVDERPKVDFIWVIDGSGSMDDENNLVKNYASDFAQILTASNLDWRAGVVSSNCQGLAEDTGISMEIKQLFGATGGGGFTSPCPTLPIGGGGLKNGELCGRDGAFFTSDPVKFEGCIDQAAGQSITSEHTITVAAAAIDRALPRAPNNPVKLREGAATVIISVTDEFDDHIQGKMGWRDAGGAGEPPNDLAGGVDYNQLDMVVQPFIDYFQRPESAATAFGIFWIPGQPCSTAAEAAAGIERIVNQTGGTAGNICDGTLQATLASIAEASAGLASGLRLEGLPLPSTIGVRVGDVSTQMIQEPPRSREQGWDYDSVTNAVSFNGADPPQTSDRVVITYRRWKSSVQGCMSDEDCENDFQKYQCRDGVCI